MHPAVIFLIAFTVVMAILAFFKRIKVHGQHGIGKEKNEATSIVVSEAPAEPAEPAPVAPVPGVATSNDVSPTGTEPIIRRVKELEAKNLELEQQAAKLQDKNRKMKENLEKYHAKNRKARRDAAKERSAAEKSSTAPTVNKRSGKPIGKNGGGFKVPANINHTVEHGLDACPACEMPLEGVNSVSHWDHVLIDIERTERGYEWNVTKHVMLRFRCPRCKALVAKDFGNLEHAHYGIGLITFVMRERIKRRLPWASIRALLEDLFHQQKNPTVPAFIEWMKKWEPEVKALYDAFVSALKTERLAHVDETGLPRDGDNWWLWVVVTGHVVLFIQSASRGSETIKELFEGYKGVMLSDFWSAYSKLDVEQQKCLAHVVKDLRNMATEASEKTIKAKAALATRPVVGETGKPGILEPEQPRKRGRPPKQPEALQADEVAKLEAEAVRFDKAFQQVSRLYEFFKQAWGEGEMGVKAPADKRLTIDEATKRLQVITTSIRQEGPATEDIRRMIDRLDKFAPALFTYLEHPGIPPDNNPAERALRHFVTQRKISANFVSTEVTNAYAMHLSLYMTCVKNKAEYGTVLELLLKQDIDGVLRLLGLRPPILPKPPEQIVCSS